LPAAGGNKNKKYKILKHEAHLVHAKISIPQFDPNTGEDQSQTQVQKFYPQEFAKMQKEQAFAGKKVEILHDGGDASDLDIEDQTGSEFLTPQIVSQPGAGLDLTKDYSQLTAAELKKVWGEFYPDANTNPAPATKKELLGGIQDRIAFLQDEKQRQDLQAQELNKLRAAKAAGQELTEDQERQLAEADKG